MQWEIANGADDKFCTAFTEHDTTLGTSDGWWSAVTQSGVGDERRRELECEDCNREQKSNCTASFSNFFSVKSRAKAASIFSPGSLGGSY